MREGRTFRTQASASSRLGMPMPVALSANRLMGSMMSMPLLNAPNDAELHGPAMTTYF
jgi:hypothetical protein